LPHRSSLYRLPLPHILHKTVAHRRGWLHVLLPCRNTSYFGWSQNQKYVQYLIRFSRQDVPQRPHLVQVSYISFLVTDFEISLITFLISASRECPTRSATSPAFTDGFLYGVLCLWFANNAWFLKCLLHSAQGILTVVKAHGGLGIQSLHVHNVSPTSCFLNALHTYRLTMAPLRFAIK
jgi:hypothetical protein